MEPLLVALLVFVIAPCAILALAAIIGMIDGGDL